MDRDIHRAAAALPERERISAEPTVELQDILLSLSRVLRRADMFEHHHIQRETLSTREKMSEILLRVTDRKFVPLASLLVRAEGRSGVIVTFLAIMELMKESLIEIVQSEPFGAIHLKSRT